MSIDILEAGERLDDLQRDGLKLIQNPDKFCFGIDAVLLSFFAVINVKDTVLDLCSGNGVIPILLAGKGKGKHFTGLEIREDAVSMANRSILYNRLQEKVTMHRGDVKEASAFFKPSSFDVITCNPPYMIANHGMTNDNEAKMTARHEILCNLDDVLCASKEILKSGGHFFMVHRPFRLAEIMSKMVEYRLEPKRLRLVFPYADKEPNMILIEGVKEGNSRVRVEKPLVVYEAKGIYTKEVRDLYE
jgi:tRNA1Val (adenine37-N6)-methyltransferase